MSYRISYKFDKDNGIAICKIDDKDIHIVGKAYCHPQDRDMMSEHTGYILAEYNAQIKYLKYIKNNDIKPQLKALLGLYYSMNRSKNYNKRSYEAKTLYRAIRRLKDELSDTQDMINDLEKNRKIMIEDKELVYKKVRENRNKKLKVLSDKND